MKILVLDNYDSFTYNLVYMLGQVSDNHSIDVFQNDELSIDQIGKYDKILLSPGPSLPDDAGIMKDVVKKYAPSKSILGVCLGHQGIAEVFGAKLNNLSPVLHGHQGRLKIEQQSDPLFSNIDSGVTIGQYHSWTVDESSIPQELEVIATDQNGLVMGIRHVIYDVRGLQFHPESIMTEQGAQLLNNWINI